MPSSISNRYKFVSTGKYVTKPFEHNPITWSDFICEDVPIPEGRVASVDPGELCACQSRRSLVTNESAEVEPEHVAGHTLMVSSCSFEADQRKDGQSIVSYSLFGDTGREEVKRRYFSSLEERAARVASAYPGELILCCDYVMMCLIQYVYPFS